MKRLQPVIIACLAAFIAGFAVAWVIKPPEVQVIESIREVAVEQPASSPTSSEQQSQQQETQQQESPQEEPPASSTEVIRDGAHARDPLYGVEVTQGSEYSSKYEVALYIHAFDELPPNYISKTKAKKQGWVANKGNLWDVLPGMSIGGSDFMNIEGELPLEYDPDRTFKECDINYEGGYRGAERLVWSDDGYIFYTSDHYESFEQLYPHEEG